MRLFRSGGHEKKNDALIIKHKLVQENIETDIFIIY